MTVLEDVSALIRRLAPEAICDDCITEKLGLSIWRHANHKTNKLVGTSGFRRDGSIKNLGALLGSA